MPRHLNNLGNIRRARGYGAIQGLKHRYSLAVGRRDLQHLTASRPELEGMDSTGRHMNK